MILRCELNTFFSGRSMIVCLSNKNAIHISANFKIKFLFLKFSDNLEHFSIYFFLEIVYSENKLTNVS